MTTKTVESTKPPSVAVDDNRSFAETLFSDAINPGVHKKSLDTTNYVLLALLICAAIALVLWNYNIHFIVIITMTIILAVLMNVNRGAILEASAEFFRQKAIQDEEDEKKKQQEAKGYTIIHGDNDGNDDEEDGEYEYIDIDDDIDVDSLSPEELDKLIEQKRKEMAEKKKQKQQEEESKKLK